MTLLDNLTTKGKDATQKAKDLAEKSKLKNQISQEQEKIRVLYETIGKVYYETDGESGNEPYNDMILAIKMCFVRISDLQEKMKEIKDKYVCPRCGATVNPTTQFCKQCGAKISTFQ